MQVKQYTIYEFSKLMSLSLATVRQMCHGYKTNNGKHQAHLPKGWTAKRSENVKGRYLIYKSGKAPAEKTLSLEEKFNKAFDPMAEPIIERVKARRVLKNALMEITPKWQKWLAEEIANTWQEELQKTAQKSKVPSLNNAVRLLEIIEEAYKIAIFSERDVTLELRLDKAGNWKPKLIAPETLSARLLTIQSTLELTVMTAWHNEVFTVKKGLRKDIKKEWPPELKGICPECLSKTEVNVYCSPSHEKTHGQWIRRVANEYKNENEWWPLLLNRLEERRHSLNKVRQ